MSEDWKSLFWAMHYEIEDTMGFDKIRTGSWEYLVGKIVQRYKDKAEFLEDEEAKGGSPPSNVLLQENKSEKLPCSKNPCGMIDVGYCYDPNCPFKP